MHSPAIHPSFLFAAAAFSILASFYVGRSSEAPIADLFALFGYGLGSIILIPSAVVLYITRSARWWWKKKQVIRRWRRIYGQRVPLLIQLTPAISFGSATLITLTYLSAVGVRLIQEINGDIAYIFGIPRSSWVILLMLVGAVMLCVLAVIGTVLASRRSLWSRPRRNLQAIAALASIFVVGPIGIIFLAGFIY